MQRKTTAEAKFAWDDLRVFLALHRRRILSRAARDLGVSTSTVSRRLAAFEASLGARLFDRIPEGLVPTSTADSLFSWAEAVERAVLASTRALDGLERGVAGLVRLTCVPGVAEELVIPSLARLRELHPSLHVQVESTGTIADLTRNEADLAVRTVRPRFGDLVARRIGNARYVLCAHHDLVEALGTLDSCRGLSWIGYPEALEDAPPMRWMRAAAPDTAPVFRSSSLAVQISAARARLGAVMLPEPLVRDVLVPVALAAASPWDTMPRAELWLVGHRASVRVPKIAAVWDHVRSVLETSRVD